jgi:regulator of protease activity HflC (stomatin/prohibitin superfamily)
MNGATSSLISTLVTYGVPLLLLVGLAVLAIRIVPEYQRLVVFRLGRLVGERGPGFVLLIPFIDRGVRVDFRERFFDVPPQTTITEDNAHLSIDFLVYMKIVDATPCVINVEDYEGAARGIAITTLRAVVGSMLLDAVLARREEINEALRGKLDEVTNRWGIKVTAVEIREITPPPEIQEAMTRQMSAERTRRAMVLEADGKRDAAIRVADGQKQAIILEAEGARQSTILRAQGLATGLEAISKVARTVDSRTMALQYLDALRSLGSAAATKIVLPMELTNILRPFVEHTGRAGAGDDARDRAIDPEAPPRH